MKGVVVNSGTVILSVLLAGGTFVSAQAAGQNKREIELTRKAILADRHEIVQLAMSFTPSELEAFKPVYREWRQNIETLGDRKIKLVTQIMEEYDGLTDAKAKTLMDEWVSLQANELELKKTYITKMSAILPAKKVARFFQLENKLDAALLYNLAGSVPLVGQQ